MLFNKKGKTKPKTKKFMLLKVIRNLFIVFLAIIIAIPVSGMIYEKVEEHMDSNNFAPPGKVISIDGHDMHIFAEGKGNSTVVFASGWGTPCPYADFYPLYSKISDKARTAVYDRPGYGWSEVCKSPRDINTIAREIHELLTKSGEKPPYIFVAHSLGSLEALRFSQLYRDEVKGIVTVDAGNPEFYAKGTDLAEASNLSFKSKLKTLGLIRLLFKFSPKFKSAAYAGRNGLSLVPQKLRDIDEAMYLKNLANRNLSEEMKNIRKNAQTVLNGGKLGNIRLRILTAESEAREQNWKKSQEEFKTWSNDSKQLIVKGSNHNMIQYYPGVINAAILEILNDKG